MIARPRNTAQALDRLLDILLEAGEVAQRLRAKREQQTAQLSVQPGGTAENGAVVVDGSQVMEAGHG